MKKSFPLYKYLYICSLLISISAIPVEAMCKERIIFGTYPIPRFVLDKYQGVFIEVTRQLAKRAELDIEIRMMPAKRVIDHFQNQQMDVLFPGLDSYFLQEFNPITSSECLFVKADFIFTKKGTPLLNTIKALEGKRVGITLGYPYVKELLCNDLIILENAPADENNFKMLLSGRIDAFVCELITGRQAAIDSGAIDFIQYDGVKPISKQWVYYAFQNTELGKRLADIVSRTLGEMKRDGTYFEILSRGQVPFNEFNTYLDMQINCRKIMGSDEENPKTP